MDVGLAGAKSYRDLTECSVCTGCDDRSDARALRDHRSRQCTAAQLGER